MKISFNNFILVGICVSGCFFKHEVKQSRSTDTNALKWWVNYLDNGEFHDSSSYLKDSNVWHGINIHMMKITTEKKSGAIEYDSIWYITEYFNGEEDGLGIGLDKNRKVFRIDNHENGWMIGYQLSFHKNGRIEKIDSISPTKESGITPWLLDSLGNILEYGNIKNTKLLKANINDPEYRYLKRLKHNIIDSSKWYWY